MLFAKVKHKNNNYINRSAWLGLYRIGNWTCKLCLELMAFIIQYVNDI
jgi:hypothetical protein